MSGKIKNLIYLIAAIIIMVIIGTALRSAGIINMKREQETEGERLPWGRDTVKQFYGGIYEISRSSAFYVFHSLDNEIDLYGITHYYCDNETDIYLIGDNNLYAHINAPSRTIEQYDTIESFDGAQQKIFKEKEFVELPSLNKGNPNIWDFLRE